ncbi:ImpJ/VasE [Acidisarcina polymorpha]|uniref:ImpJ/VasE n=1 Tax=Acidisarcina polymorpha TaxID=2211140 RepID=A0A2Z5G3Z1_9BACT|nr:type VI secretion system baseplate subunit TssK [Acidisarcina polymorpha]AXC13365.1 ImpJ/VasE [Acidisarcina polymorpha]
MRQLQPVVWSKGVFLSPQHLQAQDHFFEDSLRFTMESLSFCHWGFSSLKIESSSIGEGRLEIAEVTGLFPDGLAFDTPGADPAPGSRALDECFKDGCDACIFYLAIPQVRPGGINVALRNVGLSTRFYSELQMLRDENGSSVEKPVSLARKNLRIVAEGESFEGLVLLPLARVVRTETGRYKLDHDFIGPMIDIHASDRLMSILRGLSEVLVSRGTQLAGARRQRNQSLADFSASDVASFWLLYTINTHLPLLNHLMHANHSRPETLFLQMLSLAGALTTFSRALGPLDLPRYEHEKQGPCFLELESQLMKLLDTVIPSRFIALPLRQVRDSVYVTDIDRDEYLSNAHLYLAITSDVPTAELVSRTPALVKACSATHLETLIRQALPGVAMTHVPSPPQEIPVKLRYQYFSLDRNGVAWESIKRARNFGVYVPGEIANPQMELIVLPSDSA